MATVEQNTQQINTLTEALNKLLNESQSITDATLQNPLELGSELAVSYNGADFKTNIGEIVDLILANIPFKYNVVFKSVNYTSVTNDYIIVNSSLNDVTITLPTAIGVDGEEINVTRGDLSSNIVTVDTVLSQTILGELTQIITSQYDNLTLVSDGANWLIK